MCLLVLYDAVRTAAAAIPTTAKTPSPENLGLWSAIAGLFLAASVLLGFFGENRGHNVVGRLSWRPLDWLEAGLKGVFETSNLGDESDLFGIPEKYLSGAMCLQFYPLPEKDDLRIHALAGKNNLDGFFWRKLTAINFFGSALFYDFLGSCNITVINCVAKFRLSKNNRGHASTQSTHRQKNFSKNFHLTLINTSATNIQK
jgi:hypothetical protein